MQFAPKVYVQLSTKEDIYTHKHIIMLEDIINSHINLFIIWIKPCPGILLQEMLEHNATIKIGINLKLNLNPPPLNGPICGIGVSRNESLGLFWGRS